MTETSPGRVAFEAHQRAEASQLRSEQARAMAVAGKGWETLAPYEQRAWDVTAQAVLSQAFPGLKRERDEAKAAASEIAERSGENAARLVLATAETRDLRQLVDEILGKFGPSGSGHSARVGQVQIAKWRTRAGLTTGSNTRESE